MNENHKNGHIKKLSYTKKLEYDNLCAVIRNLSAEIEHLQKAGQDTSEIDKKLGIALEKCFEFVRREFYH